MTPTYINFLVQENGGQATVAKQIGCTRVELAQVTNGHRVNEPLREKLAKFLGISKERLFDGEFQAVVNYRAQERKTA